VASSRQVLPPKLYSHFFFQHHATCPAPNCIIQDNTNQTSQFLLVSLLSSVSEFLALIFGQSLLFFLISHKKRTFLLSTILKTYGGMDVQLHAFLTQLPNESEWLGLHCSRLMRGEKSPARTRWGPEQAWSCEEQKTLLTPQTKIGIWFLCHPVRSLVKREIRVV